MDAQTDAQLLRAYAERRSDAAFAELVRRHIDLVHSAARRMVGDAHLADDVTQATFLALAKSAAQLTERPVLAGWLHRTAQNIAAQTVRTDVRRRAREQEAAAMNELLADSGTDVPPAWSEIAPHLDAALGDLTEPERDAVLLRYFNRQSAREMAQTLGISDDAAQKRVSRAVERLREFFANRGVTVGASGLAVVISANAMQAAPVGLALTISTAAGLIGTTLATTATVTATKAIAMTTFQKTIVTATLTVAIGVAVYQTFEASRLRSQIRELQKALANQTQTLVGAKTEANNQLASLQEENNRLNRNTGELLKLRGEVNRLRRQTPVLSAAIPPTIEITTNDPPFQTYTATNHIDLAWNQTLVTGGWKTPSGDRVLVLATLTPLPDAAQLMLRVKIVDVANEHFKTVWPDGMAADSNDSKTGILQREQFDPFYEKLTQFGSPRVRDLAMTTTTGKECIMNLDNEMIGWTPTISADGKTVKLEFTSNLKYPTTTSVK